MGGFYVVNHNMHNLNTLITQLLDALVRRQQMGLKVWGGYGVEGNYESRENLA